MGKYCGNNASLTVRYLTFLSSWLPLVRLQRGRRGRYVGSCRREKYHTRFQYMMGLVGCVCVCVCVGGGGRREGGGGGGGGGQYNMNTRDQSFPQISLTHTSTNPPLPVPDKLLLLQPSPTLLCDERLHLLSQHHGAQVGDHQRTKTLRTITRLSGGKGKRFSHTKRQLCTQHATLVVGRSKEQLKIIL